MPTKRVLLWYADSRTPPPQSDPVSSITDSIESIVDGGVVNIGTWKVQITIYDPVLRGKFCGGRAGAPAAGFPRLYGVSFSDEPKKYYLYLDNERIVVEADSGIVAMIDLIGYRASALIFNVEGPQYGLGDFRVRIGRMIRTQYKYVIEIVMEVEYRPSSSIVQCKRLMDEFVLLVKEEVSKKSPLSLFVPAGPNFSEYGLSDNYTSQHTVAQYVALLTQLD